MTVDDARRLRELSDLQRHIDQVHDLLDYAGGELADISETVNSEIEQLGLAFDRFENAEENGSACPDAPASP